MSCSGVTVTNKNTFLLGKLGIFKLHRNQVNIFSIGSLA